MNAQQKLLYGTELVQDVKGVQRDWTGDGKWDTRGGGDGEGERACTQKASLDECPENPGPAQLGSNPLLSLGRMPSVTGFPQALLTSL